MKHSTPILKNIHLNIKHKLCVLLLLCVFFVFNSVDANAQYPNYRSYDAEDEPMEEIYDPIEPVNRFMFAFNENFYDYFGNYVVIAYRKVTTKDMRNSAVNFLDNIKSPVTLATSVVMLDYKRSANVVSRFVINTTLGFLGLFDVAGQMGIKDKKDDMGLAFAKYGVGPGPYLVIPLFGSTTLRDGTGTVVEVLIDPLNFNVLQVDGSGSWLQNDARFTRTGATSVTEVESIKDFFDETRRDSFDPYATIRSIYLQNRKEKIRRIKEGN